MEKLFCLKGGKFVKILLLFLFFQASSFLIYGEARISEMPALKSDDRILILAPHPDDEVLGCAGIVQKALSMKLPVRIVFFTYGDNNEWAFILYRKHLVVFPKAVRNMGLLRHEEAIAAAAVLGLSKDSLIFLGYPDFGTFSIWCQYWNEGRKPYKSMLTKVTAVPYQSAYRPGASYRGGEILKDLTSVIRDFKPTKVFVSHAADHHPDHRALYLFARVALWDLEKEMNPELFPYLVHYKNFPTPSALHPDLAMNPPPSLEDDLDWKVSPLKKEEIDLKLNALQKHKSQLDSSRKYLLSFIRTNEMFGEFQEIRLKGGRTEKPVLLENPDPEFIADPPDQLIGQEKAVYVGLEWRYARIEGENLVMSIMLSQPLGKDIQVTLYAFGYNPEKEFSKMPKISVRLNQNNYVLFNQREKILEKFVSVERKAREISVHIPLKELGSPDRILISARTYWGSIPLDWVSWRIIDIKDQKK